MVKDIGIVLNNQRFIFKCIIAQILSLIKLESNFIGFPLNKDNPSQEQSYFLYIHRYQTMNHTNNETEEIKGTLFFKLNLRL